MPVRSKIAIYALLILVSLIFSLPMIMMVSGSLQTAEQLARNPNSFPETAQWENYPRAISSMPFARYLTNTLLMCVGCVIGTTLSCSVVAYGLCRVQWRGRRLVILTVIATMLLPWQIMLSLIHI